MDTKDAGAMGGKARAAKLSPKRRQTIAGMGGSTHSREHLIRASRLAAAARRARAKQRR